jgi:small subunit ribosomal protein S1
MTEGTVTSLTDFGAFVDVGKGVEGLVHISEMPAGRATLEGLKPGAQVSVRVLEFDQEKRHIALSMRGVTETMGESLPSSVWEDWQGEGESQPEEGNG